MASERGISSEGPKSMHPSPGGAESGTTLAGVDIAAPSAGGDNGEEVALCIGGVAASWGGAVMGGMLLRRMSSTRVLTASKASEYFESRLAYWVVISAKPVLTWDIFSQIFVS
jgi:hypothetical protein